MFIEHMGSRSIDQVDNLVADLSKQAVEEVYQNMDFENFPSVISDFQGASLKTLQDIVADTTVQRNFIVTGAVTFYKNASVDSLWVDFNPDDFSQTRVIIRIMRSTALEEENLIFRLMHKERQLSSVVLKSDDIDQVVFDVPAGLYGGFTVEIEGDQVFYDNTFHFTISQRMKPVIAIIDAGEENFLQQVFTNESLFTVYSMKSDAVDFDNLRKADVIVFSGLSNLPTGLSNEIANKTCIVFPPTELEDDFDFSWLGFSLTPSLDTIRNEMELDPYSPLFSGVFTKKNTFDALPTSASYFDLRGNYETLIRLRNGKASLVRSLDGHNYFFNVPLDLKYTSLPTHSIFLPILYKIVLSTKEYDAAPYFYPGDLAQLKAEFSDTPPKIVADNLEVIPDHSPMENGISYRIPQLESGFYQLLHQKDTFEIAVNSSKAESIMSGLSHKELEENFGNLDHVTIQSAEAQALTMSSNEQALWKYALILVLFILLTETLFHKYLR